MSAPQKLTDAEIRLIREAMAKRWDLQRQLDMMDSLEELATKFNVSSRYLRDVVYNRARVIRIVEVA